ncbi:MAG: hypothetical protein Q9225_000259 [Loekoesia sp. 1 TL-2023]
MGKRKKSSRKPQAKKKKDPLPSTFPCLFCNHENSVSVKMDKKAGIGELLCKVCGQQFQTGINYLSAGVDVYSDWIDACDSVAKEATYTAGDGDASSHYQGHTGMGVPERHVDMPSGRQTSTVTGGQDDDMGGYGEDDD